MALIARLRAARSRPPEPGSDTPPRIRQAPGTVPALAAAAVLVIAALVGFGWFDDDETRTITDTPSTTTAPPTSTTSDASSVDDAAPLQTEADTIDISDAVSEISFGVRTSDQIAAGAGSIWVSTSLGPGELLRIDSVTGAVAASIQLGLGYDSAPAVSDDAVWIAGAESLYRIDPVTSSIVAEIDSLALSGVRVAVADDSVWVSGRSAGSLVVRRIDPATNSITATIWIEIDPAYPRAAAGAITVGPDGDVYVDGDGTIYRIDPSTNTVAGSAEVAQNELGLRIAVDDDSAWVVRDSRDGRGSSVVRIDAALEGPAQTVFAPASGMLGGVSIVDGRVVVGNMEGSLYLLDQTSGAPTKELEIGNGRGGQPSFAVSEGFLWISNGKLWRLPLSELDIPPSS